MPERSRKRGSGRMEQRAYRIVEVSPVVRSRGGNSQDRYRQISCVNEADLFSN